MTNMLKPLCAIACLIHASACLAQQSKLPRDAQVVRDDKGSVVEVKLVGKSNHNRLAVTPEMVKELSQLRELRSLSLWGTTVNDDDLRQLINLKALQSVDLSFTQVSGQSIKILSPLKELVSLRLDSCNVTDDHLADLKLMPQLSMLYLRNTKVTDRGMKDIRNLDQVLLLELSDCVVTDEGLMSLGRMPVIQHLWLSKTIRYGENDRSAFTDDCVAYLSSLKSLRDLRIADSRITDASIEKLRMALPDAKVDTERSGVTYLSSRK